LKYLKYKNRVSVEVCQTSGQTRPTHEVERQDFRCFPQPFAASLHEMFLLRRGSADDSHAQASKPRRNPEKSGEMMRNDEK
jgi:hypothetical protein